MITIYDIAKKANVSAMTVSKVINHTGRISSATRERVQQVIDELGYIPNSNARSLVLQRTQMLSCLLRILPTLFIQHWRVVLKMQPIFVGTVFYSAIVTRITKRKRIM